MWRFRKREYHPDPETVTAREEAREALAEVRAMRAPALARNHRLQQLAQALDEIREENHFSKKIFGEA